MGVLCDSLLFTSISDALIFALRRRTCTVSHQALSNMQAVEQNLKSFLATLPARPLERQTLDTLAERTLSQTQATANPESWKNRWEYVLRKEIFDLAVRYLYHLP